jgi:hypothetical protein
MLLFNSLAAVTPAAATAAPAAPTVPSAGNKATETPASVHTENKEIKSNEKANTNTLTAGSYKLTSEMSLVLLPLSILVAKLF